MARLWSQVGAACGLASKLLCEVGSENRAASQAWRQKPIP